MIAEQRNHSSCHACKHISRATCDIRVTPAASSIYVSIYQHIDPPIHPYPVNMSIDRPIYVTYIYLSVCILLSVNMPIHLSVYPHPDLALFARSCLRVCATARAHARTRADGDRACLPGAILLVTSASGRLGAKYCTPEINNSEIIVDACWIIMCVTSGV